ncbi:uncharacterized protein ARMOST_18805 [Armillaria ostoyae]|uniref:Uncharacterized protein n=1 Tax=Armillaria ostoyae TaxID=47428 RepID=A0A284S2S1_ARMOS|nr:uncharacterized protein ARMOST_18805 [Armillaria ostoyae]
MSATKNYVGELNLAVNHEYLSQEERSHDYNDELDFLDNKYADNDNVISREWHFSEGERVMTPNSLTGIVTRIHPRAVEVCTVDGTLWYSWQDIVKSFGLGDYVEVVGGDLRGRHGFVLDVSNDIYIDVMEGHYSQGVRDLRVHHNLAKVISPPTTSNSFALSPEEIAKRMHTGRVPWQGLHILILPSTTLSKKRRFDQLEKSSHLGHEADVHKGKIGKVLDVGINQATASGLSVYVHLEQSYSAVHAYRDIWVDYDKVVEETMGLPLRLYQPLDQSQAAFLPSQEYRCARKEQENISRGQRLASEVTLRLRRTSPPPPRACTPLHEGSSEDLGTGNAWDVTAPEPPAPSESSSYKLVLSHWSEHPAFAQRELRVNIPGKSQPQKIQLDLSGTGCIMKIKFRTTLVDVGNWKSMTPVEPTVRDYHRWVVIRGDHVGMYARGVRYVQGSKPILWTVQEIKCVDNEHDLLIGEVFDILNTDLCQVADSQQTLDINAQWAHSIREEPTKVKNKNKK